MQVLLVNPNRMQPAVAPLAIDYLGEALALHGVECRVLDLCLQGTAPTPDSLPLPRNATTSKPDAVLVSFRNLDDAYFFSQESFLPVTRTLIEDLRREFGAPVIVGGSGFSIAPEEILRFLGADFGVSGSAERDLARVLSALREPDRYPELPGFVWRQGREIRANPASPPDLRTDFYSARRLVNNRAYFQAGGMLGLETKRGCPGACRYCVDPLGKGATAFAKPLPVLVREIRTLLDQGANVFHLCDSEFNLPREHALSVCRALRDEGLDRRVAWFTYATPQGFDDELALEMAAAGCAGVNFGVDHCRPGILQALGRSHDQDDLCRTASACRRAGLHFLFDLLLGGPGENRATLREVIDLCRSLDVLRVGANAGIRVYPHTPLAREILANGPLDRNPHLAGCLLDNDSLLRPLFYLSAAMGPGWEGFLQELVGDDRRFFLPIRAGKDRNNNYNENRPLVDAIRAGHRGAFWDILYRLQEGLPPLQVPT